MRSLRKEISSRFIVWDIASNWDGSHFPHFTGARERKILFTECRREKGNDREIYSNKDTSTEKRGIGTKKSIFGKVVTEENLS